ncbi:NUDIX hydrolase [Trichodesmium erythraeum IMS101]|uniref:NUDIX hydrolase n=1 Tax=Trichodesmium erythraeum (strain IMS101) TaxID=203124 RepID=Q10X48_TRIEI|nr:NUDIX hydrolase [Trichodesmium erythraeum GBRTRLIN201]MCH2049836.1 NUDIX hydrolase [Trichodesmium sp. ALOHA_ZT_67]MDE5096549.1 NUDIX hydrolase [Trichodesmium sp. St11_bin5]MDT9337964.1 NUDIX hydrolase [Trichodesmium erythraeum 21-75]
MNNNIPHVAIAILYREEKFLLQLRDDIPGIAHPGQWAFFGGHIEPGEIPQVAIKRELVEEIGYKPDMIWEFGVYYDTNVVRHVFYAPLTVELKDLVLGEGWDMGLLTPTEIKTGKAYSENAGMERSLGEFHQKILLDFMNTQGYVAKNQEY